MIRESNIIGKRSWNPVLHGDVCCSPACGGRCKKVDHDWAVSQALKPATELGAGWEPSVHENLAWFYRAKKGYADISPDPNFARDGIPGGRYQANERVRYTGFLNLPGKQFVITGGVDDSPTAVYEAALALPASSFMAAMNVHMLEQRLNIKEY